MLLETGGARRRVRNGRARPVGLARAAGRAARHVVEPVERRVMLAVTLSGTSGDDTIAIVATPAATTVTINGTPTVVPVTPSETIVINAGGGADTINVEGATIPVTVNGEIGDDRIALSPLAMNLDAIERRVTFNGGAGADAAVLNDQTNSFDEEFTVDAELIQRGFFGGLAYSEQTESLTLNNGLDAGVRPSPGSPARGASSAAEGSDGSNVINIDSLPQATTLVLNTGGGDDQIHFAPAGMLLDPIEGPVLVNGEAGSDALRLSDQNNAFPDEWDISAEAATRPNFGGVTYDTIEALRLDAGLFSATQPAATRARDDGAASAGAEGGGDNVFNITSLPAPTTVSGGAGNDNFFLGQAGTLAPLAGVPLTLSGQSGIDQVFVDDSLNAADDAFTLTTNTVAQNATTLVTYATMERLRLDLGAGVNTVSVISTAATVTIFGGAGEDVVQLGAGSLDPIDGRVTVDGEGGNDAIFINDQTPAAARDYVVSDRDVSSDLLATVLTYLNVEAMTLRATGGANNVTVEETAPATPLTLVSGAGDDVVVVNDDGTGSAEVLFGGVEDLAALDVRNGGRARIAPGGSNVLRLGALATAGTGALDITNNAAIIDYAGPASPLLDVRAQVTSGYAGGAWTGGGITSSTAAAIPNRAVGYGEAAALFTAFPATFAGQSVDNTSILLRYTRYGDANLDGAVNLLDFNRLAGNFGVTGTPLWTQGNFNFDDAVNLLDFNRLAANFGQSA